MINSADVRKQNMCLIRTIMRDGNVHSKQSLASATGLSVATCNTLLNEMAKNGEVTGEKGRLNTFGPGATLYRLNESFESYLCVYFEFIQSIKTLNAVTLSPTGQIIERKNYHSERIDYAFIESIIAQWVERHSNIVQIVIGTPSIAEHGVIRHSDIPELEAENIVEKLTARFHLPISVENDMRYKAYGYYKLEGDADKVVTLVNYPSHILPGTATIHKGTILTGANGFAGMVGFLTYDMPKEQYLQQLSKETGVPLVAKAVTALIATVNPNIIVFTGDMLDESCLDDVLDYCQRDIPQEYMPTFIWEDSFDEYYVNGMYYTAIDRRESTEFD